MNRLNLAAFILVLLLVAVRLLGQSAAAMAPTWNLPLSVKDFNQLLWYASVLPAFIIHFGIALWIQDRAMSDQQDKPMLWGIFGLCFGPMAGVIYLAYAIVEKRRNA